MKKILIPIDELCSEFSYRVLVTFKYTLIVGFCGTIFQNRKCSDEKKCSEL